MAPRGKRGKSDKSDIRSVGGHSADNVVKSLNEQMNPSKPAVDESAQEAPEQNKPKRGKVAELTKLLEEAKKRAQQAEEQVQQQQKRIKDLEAEGKQKSEGIQILNDNLRDQTQAYKNRIAELEDSNKVYINGAKSLINRKKEADEKNERLLKTNQDLMDQRSILTESIRQSALKSPKEVDQAQEAFESASEPKVDNSAKTEGTATPETEVKAEGEPKANTEQAQVTQEPNGEAKQTSTESSEMTPEEVYDYLSDKKNFKDAEQYFASGKDAYVGTNDKRIPKSWFDTFKENKDKNHKKLWFNKNNKDVFTASLRDKGLLEDLNKTPDRAETVRVKAETAAKAEFDKSIKTMGNKLLGVMGKHPAITTALILTAGVPGAIKFINDFRNSSREQDIEDAQVSDSAFFDSEDNEDFNGDDPGEVAEKVANAAQETKQAGNNAEEQAAQALQENLPQGEADTTNQNKDESPIATNASTPASAKASTTESAPTQGLPPVVTRNTPSTNPNSSGMTYSQRVEAEGQAPKEGSMAYNANNPDMVTANLINAMNQNPQAGSDAIGYGDLYDQNFIDFWAKRNPNLAFGVSQGRR